MSDVELSSDSDEVKSSEELSVYEKKPEEKKEEKTYDGVPVVSSDDEEPPEEKKEVLEDVQGSDEETTSEGPDTKKKTPERAELNHRAKGLKSLSQKLKEKAFKKADLAGEDLELINHRLERRALSERLEEDSEFRAQYIQEQEERKKEAEDESMNFSNTSELIDQVNRLQSKRRGESSQSSQSSDDETVHSVSHQSYSSHIVDDDDFSSSQKPRTFKTKNRGAPAKAGIYIHIEHLTLNL